MAFKPVCDAREYYSIMVQLSKEKGYIYAHRLTGACEVFKDKVKTPEIHPNYYPLTLRDIVSLGSRLKQDLMALEDIDNTPSETLKGMCASKANKEATSSFCVYVERIINLATFYAFENTSSLASNLAESIFVKTLVQNTSRAPIIESDPPPSPTILDNPISSPTILDTPISSPTILDTPMTSATTSATAPEPLPSALPFLPATPFTMELKEINDKLKALKNYKEGQRCNIVQTRTLFAELKMGSLLDPEVGKIDTVVRLLQYVSGFKEIDLNNPLHERVIIDIFNHTNSTLVIDFIEWLEKEPTFNPGLYLLILRNYFQKLNAAELTDSDYSNILKLLGVFENTNWHIPVKDYERVKLAFNHPTIIGAVVLILNTDRNAVKYQAITAFIDKVIHNGRLHENFEPIPLNAKDKFDYITFRRLMGPYIGLRAGLSNSIHDKLLAAFKKYELEDNLRADTSPEGKKILYHIFPEEAPAKVIIEVAPPPKPVPKKAHTVHAFPNAVLAKLSRQNSEKSLSLLGRYQKAPTSLNAIEMKNLWREVKSFELPEGKEGLDIVSLIQILPKGSDLSSENCSQIVIDAFRNMSSIALGVFLEKLTLLTGDIYYHNFDLNLVTQILRIIPTRNEPEANIASILIKLLEFYKQQKGALNFPINDEGVRNAIGYLIEKDPEGSRFKTKNFMEWSIHTISNAEGKPEVTYLLEYETFKLWLEKFLRITCSNITTAEQTLICHCRDYKPEYAEMLKEENPAHYGRISVFFNKGVGVPS